MCAHTFGVAAVLAKAAQGRAISFNRWRMTVAIRAIGSENQAESSAGMARSGRRG